MKTLRLFVFGIISSLVLELPLFAETASAALPANKTIEERLLELEQEIKVLKRLRENEQEETSKKAKENAVVSANAKDGFKIKSPDNNFSLKAGGYIHADSRNFLNGGNRNTADTFSVRRVRPIFEGTVFKNYDYRIMFDFGNGSSVLQDAYVDVNYFPQAKLRLGRFKPPFGLENLQGDTALSVIERAYPTSLGPVRDVGAQLFGDLWSGAVSYGLGIFNGTTDGGSGDNDTNKGKDFVGRIFLKPFQNTSIWSLQDLGVGLASSFGTQSGTISSSNLPSYKTEGQNTFFSYRSTGVTSTTTIADGPRVRFAPQANYYYGPFGTQFEYVVSNQQVSRNAGAGNSTLTENLANKAWQIQASYVLTGEKASYKGVTPNNPFDPSKGKWGAFEAVVRYSQFDIDDKAFPTFADSTRSFGGAKTLGFGFNWYLNKYAKYMIDFAGTSLNRAIGAGESGREAEYAVLNRLQLQY